MSRESYAIAGSVATQQWGKVTSRRKLCDGVYLFDTEGHGGVVVDTEVHPEMSMFNVFVECGKGGQGYTSEQHFAAFEEDCMVAVPYYLLFDKTHTKKFFETCYGGRGKYEDWLFSQNQYIVSSLGRWNPVFLKYQEQYSENWHKYYLPEFERDVKVNRLDTLGVADKETREKLDAECKKKGLDSSVILGDLQDIQKYNRIEEVAEDLKRKMVENRIQKEHYSVLLKYLKVFAPIHCCTEKNKTIVLCHKKCVDRLFTNDMDKILKYVYTIEKELDTMY